MSKKPPRDGRQPLRIVSQIENPARSPERIIEDALIARFGLHDFRAAWHMFNCVFTFAIVPCYSGSPDAVDAVPVSECMGLFTDRDIFFERFSYSDPPTEAQGRKALEHLVKLGRVRLDGDLVHLIPV